MPPLASLVARVPARLRAPLACVALALLGTFPLVLSPFSRLVGHEDADVWNHAWGPWWFWSNLRSGTLPFYTTLLGWPDGGALWYIDPLGALIGLPFVPVFGPIFAYNLSIVANVAIAVAGGRALATRLGASTEGAWVAAVVVAVSPYLRAEIWNGVSEAVGVGAGTWALVKGIDALREGTAKAWAVTGILLGVTTIGSHYYGIAAVVALALYAIPSLRECAFWKAFPAMALGAVVCVALVAPARLFIDRSVAGEDALVDRPIDTWRPEDVLSLQEHNAVDPRTFVTPLSFQSVDLLARGEPFYHSSYLGLFAIALAVLSRRPRLLLPAIGLLLLSLGPWLWWDGAWLRVGGARLALPYRALFQVLPPSGLLHPQRLSWIVVVLVAAAAGVAASRWDRRYLPLLSTLVALDGLFLGPVPWPLPRTPPPDTAAHAAIARRKPSGSAIAVLDLPAEVGRTMASSRFLFDQTISGRPIPYVPDVRVYTSSMLHTPPGAVLLAPALPAAQRRLVVGDFVEKLTQVDPRDLERQGIGWVVVHGELDRGSGIVAVLREQLEAWFGKPEVYGDHAVWNASGEPGGSGRITIPARWAANDGTASGD